MLLSRKSRLKLNKAQLVEHLEERCLLSSMHFFMPVFRGFGGGGLGTSGLGGGGWGMFNSGQTIQFSLLPTSIQNGLDALASADNVAAPSATQTVFLANSNGIESYTVDIQGTGTNNLLTVDQSGAPVKNPVLSTATFGTIPDAPASTEISAIAAALNLTPPDPSANVNVSTGAITTYTINLTSGTGRRHRTTTISVDSNGNPVGNQTIPFSSLLPAVQAGLNANAPSGATALSAASLVTVKTLDGVTTYSATFHATGIRTTVTVDENGKLADLPSTSVAQFSTLLPAVQSQLQALATAEGVTATIDPTQNVTVHDEANGTIIYSVRLTTSTTGKSGHTFNYSILVSMDQDGNPTVPSNDGGFFGNLFGGLICS